MNKKYWVLIKVVEAKTRKQAERKIVNKEFDKKHFFADVIIELDNLKINYPVKYKQIESIAQLKKLCVEYPDGLPCAISLKYGMRSSKTVWYNAKKDVFRIFNYIDNATQNIKAKKLNDKNITNIGEAIKKGSFYYEL